mmetsp:Transcript_22883/g.74547  ORF Transcript_22883/g.74547 Transcript_22883/m.74547 type:complete len:235 (+) Transcript_22883:1201-1905(+)
MENQRSDIVAIRPVIIDVDGIFGVAGWLRVRGWVANDGDRPVQVNVDGHQQVVFAENVHLGGPLLHASVRLHPSGGVAYDALALRLWRRKEGCRFSVLDRCCGMRLFALPSRELLPKEGVEDEEAAGIERTLLPRSFLRELDIHHKSQMKVDEVVVEVLLRLQPHDVLARELNGVGCAMRVASGMRQRTREEQARRRGASSAGGGSSTTLKPRPRQGGQNLTTILVFVVFCPRN